LLPLIEYPGGRRLETWFAPEGRLHRVRHSPGPRAQPEGWTCRLPACWGLGGSDRVLHLLGDCASRGPFHTGPLPCTRTRPRRAQGAHPDHSLVLLSARPTAFSLADYSL